MFKKRLSFTIVAIILTVALVLSGCTKNKSPKDALQSSMTKSAEMKSYKFKGSMKIDDLNVSEDALAEDGAASAIKMLKSADLSWTGTYKADPMMLELNLKLALQGDLAVTFNIPVIMTEEKVWVKIPNIPILPIPEDIVGKFLELDLKKLAEDAGQELPNMDVSKSQKFGNDLMGIIFKNIEEDKYLSEIKVKDAGLPADVDVKNVVQFHIDQSQLESFVNTVIDKIAPQVIELLQNNEEYRKLLNVKPEDLEEAKKQLADVKDGDVANGLADMKKELKKLDVKANIGIDKKEFPVYTDAKIQADIESADLTGGITFHLVSQMSNINEDVKFDIGKPKAEEIVTMDKLQEQLGGMFGGGLDGIDSSL
ncbi:hypothetical protein D7Z26_26635 [Cohnella endophytica]|uniref:Lipoprotein n=1 Tax=Cohnella endophytica TaxID=2419778 RepID=A0A494X2D1_9BACL|nr:hypothetical protein [Cohnella endophytica]RKP44490.1 hypothetical protein D7Z26_26635 [Cohnella endophytica]